jgi:soluble lytic murein transglycosylase
MSSMWRVAVIIPLLLGTVPSSSAQYAAPGNYAAAPAYSSQSVAWAEKAMQPGENAQTVLAFFGQERPKTGNGWARLAEAYAATGQASQAIEAARHAWTSADLSATDEQAIWNRYGRSFTRADNDSRVDALLFAKKADDAARFLTATSPDRQAAFAARIAMQQNATDADSRYGAVIGGVTRDAGLMMDRARWLRANNFSAAAQQLAARDHDFTYKPADPERFMDMLILIAGDAVDDRNWQTAYNVASQIDDVLPAGTNLAEQPINIRDDYTTLTWIAGTVALDRMNRPQSAIAMFDRYARAGRSLQVQTKGYYWAGRAALAAGQFQDANAYFQRAAAYPDLFYGQLALERLGRSVAPPPAALPQYVTTQLQRTAFNNRPIVQAIRILGQQGRSTEQALFVKALAEALDNDTDRNLAVDFGQQISRQDVAVWTSRMARVKGSMFYVRQAYPTLPSSVSGEIWSLAHGISRQESSFDPYAVSHAGARGMMQLMTGTAREQAGKMGVGFDSYRLISDPSYNVLIGSAYFNRLLNNWNGSVPLAVAAYNAGSGNVSKWINRYGDPRGQVDMLKWIEAIPYTETRAYVQRVIENSVVYDSLRSNQPQQTAIHVSRYLGKDRPG